MNKSKLTPVALKVYELLETDGVQPRDIPMVIRNCCMNIVEAATVEVNVDRRKLAVFRDVVWFNCELGQNATLAEWGVKFRLFMTSNNFIKLEDINSLELELMHIDRMLDDPRSVFIEVNRRERGPKFLYVGGNRKPQARTGVRKFARVKIVNELQRMSSIHIDFKAIVREYRNACVEALDKRVGIKLGGVDVAKASEDRGFGKDKLSAWTADGDNYNRVRV